MFAMADAAAQVDEPTDNCLCEPVPRVHPDTEDFSIQCQIDADKYAHVVHAEMNSDREACQRLEEVEALLASRQEEVTSLGQLKADLESQLKSLRARVNTLNEENELLKRTFAYKKNPHKHYVHTTLCPGIKEYGFQPH